MDWDDLDIFCHVIDHGSFTAAARVLRRPKSSVSASVTRLEARLGTRMIERTTRKLRLTEAGESLYREMAPLFGHLREALGNAAAQNESVSGRLRIAAPYEFGAHHLGAAACAMLAEYPELEVDIEVEHQPVNLFDQQYDIVFTMVDKDLPSTSGAVRRVFTLERGVFASPALLAGVDPPSTPYDLKSLPLLAAPSDTDWAFTDSAGGRHAIDGTGPLDLLGGDDGGYERGGRQRRGIPRLGGRTARERERGAAAAQFECRHPAGGGACRAGRRPDHRHLLRAVGPRRPADASPDRLRVCAAEGLRAASGAAADARQGPVVPRHPRSDVQVTRLLMNDLNGRIFFQSELPEFHSETRSFDAAERRERLDRAVIVDPGRAALESRGDGLRLCRVARPG